MVYRQGGNVLATLIVSVVILGSTRAAAGNETDVYFSLIVSSAPTLNSSGVVPQVNRTLELINNESAILPGYTLKFSGVLETQVRPQIDLFNIVV